MFAVVLMSLWPSHSCMSLSEKHVFFRSANGINVVFFGGGRLEVRASDGRIQKADALYQTNRDGSSTMYIREDLAKYTPEQLYKHETFHDIMNRNKGLLLDMVEDLYEKYSEAEISKMVDAYVVATDGIYGDGEDAVRLYLEEILADQYSGMNRGGNEAARAREAVAGTAQRFAGDIENARQNRAGIDNRNGPGQRFSNGGLDKPNDEVNWAVDEGIIDWKDRKRLYEAIADIKKRGYNHTRTEDGEYLIDNDNKIMFVSGSFSHPRLTRVIVFNDNSATRWQYARDYIYKETARSGRYDAARSFIEAAYGEGHVELYNAKDDGRNAWEIQRGAGKAGGEIYRGDSESDSSDGEIDWIGKSSENQRFSAAEDEEDDGLTFTGNLRRTYEEDGGRPMCLV